MATNASNGEKTGHRGPTSKEGEQESSTRGMPWWVTAGSILVVPVVLTLITQYATYSTQKYEALYKIKSAETEATEKLKELQNEATQKSRELDIHMVEIAVSLLTPDPSNDPKRGGAREWALDVMERYSGVKFSANARQLIIGNAVQVDREILQGSAPAAAPQPTLPLIQPQGLDELVILSDPDHRYTWTRTDGTDIDFTQPVTDNLIKAKTPNLRVLGGHIHMAYVSQASAGVPFLAGLKLYATQVNPGTCFKLVGRFPISGCCSARSRMLNAHERRQD